MAMGRPRASTIDVQTPERLLAAAEEVFAADGFARARLADIAGRAGVTRPALLYHFATKLALYEAVVARAFASLGEIVHSAMSAGGDFHQRLRAVIDGFLAYVSVHPALARLVVREIVADSPGRTLVLAFGAPLVDDVVAFLEHEAAPTVKGVPVRAALMMVVADTFLKTAAGDVRAALWGDGEHAWAVASALLLPEVHR